MLRRHLARAVWIGLAFGLVLAGPARTAAADPIPVKSGKVVLPLTGLAVDLPADKRKNATWMLSGSWSLTDGGAAFDGRDVVDLKVGDKLVAGNWVHIGYFNAGDCAAVVKELDVPDRWTGEKTLWGMKFQVAGGTWDFENDLGKKPAIALCVANADGGSLLLYHFFLEDKAPVGKAGLAPIVRDKFLERVAKAWKAGSYGAAQPATRPEIKQRGDLTAARTVTLPQSKLEVTLPVDGFVWIVRPGAVDGSDFLDRMAPSLPDISLEIGRVPGQPCAAIMKAMAEGVGLAAEPPPTNVPFGWTAYPTLQLEKTRERVICKDVGGAALVVGLLATPSTTASARDFGPMADVIRALADATVK